VQTRRFRRARDIDQGGNRVLILGLILLLIGWLTGIGILTTLGIILLVIGAVLWILGSTGRPVGGRRYWY
jgi:membrane protein implicated in regulation of membrane protease activity